MKKIFFFVALLFSGRVLAAEVSQAVSLSVPADASLEGLVGIGFDSVVSGISPNQEIAAPSNAFSVRYWSSDKLAWEALLSLGVQTQGADASGNSATVSNSALALALGVQYLFQQISEDILWKFGGRVTFSHGIRTEDGQGSTDRLELSSLGLSLQSGLEGFLPWWPCLSLEGSIGISLVRVTTSSNLLGLGTSNSSSLSVFGRGFLPAEVAVHYYF